MKHLVIYAHPNPKSFNHAILETVVNKLKSLGASVNVRDLYEEGFNPLYNMGDIEAQRTGQMMLDVLAEQKCIDEADKITFIAPIWWGGLPAMLKGYFDRVFTLNFAVVQTSSGMEGLLGTKKFGMINTMEASEEDMQKSGALKILDYAIDKNIFEFCKSPLCFHKYLYQINSVGEKQRKEMLFDIEKLIEKFVLDSTFCPFFG